MAKTILNFHFDYLNPSLRWIAVINGSLKNSWENTKFLHGITEQWQSFFWTHVILNLMITLKLNTPPHCSLHCTCPLPWALMWHLAKLVGFWEIKLNLRTSENQSYIVSFILFEQGFNNHTKILNTMDNIGYISPHQFLDHLAVMINGELEHVLFKKIAMKNPRRHL